MKARIIIISLLAFLLIPANSRSQDVRLTETKVADLLARFPANDAELTDKLMDEMLSLGEEGIKSICDQIIPAGNGDDTKARFAVETLSRFLSGEGKEAQRPMWEKICISYATGQKDAGVKDFFMKQIQLIGSEASVEPLKACLIDIENCEPAVAAILSTGGKTAEAALAESLKNKNLKCPAAVMNALAKMKSEAAVNECIEWSSNINPDIKASAYNALARSASPMASSVLEKAAKDAGYGWDRTGATSALLDYARNIGQKGDIRTMDKICRLIMAKCDDRSRIQNKTAAMKIYTGFHGPDAMKILIRAAGHPDKTYRNAAFQTSLSIPGNVAVSKWIGFYPKAMAEARPEIIALLGNSGEESALPLLTSALSDPDGAVRAESAAALIKIIGSRAAPELIDYMKKFTSSSDQKAATEALMTISGNREVELLKPVLNDGPPEAKKSAIEIMAWSRNNKYFTSVLPYTTSDDENLRSAAFGALADLSSPDDMHALLDLLAATDDNTYILNIQDALASAAMQITDPEKRSAEILQVVQKPGKGKFIPILARTGGREALSVVLKEFENGNPDMRDICFKTLTSWHDYTASSALYEICASGNKTFEEPAFMGYVRQIRTAILPDEQKLLLFRKIMPYALSSGRKNEILAETGKLKTYPALFFTANYLDDPVTSAAAAKAAMNIALPEAGSENGLYGANVREILTKAMPALTGSESEYEREMVNKYLSSMPSDEGFVSIFNGRDLTGWQGLVENPAARAKMSRTELDRKQAEANVMVPANWSVKDGCIWFNGKGNNLCSIKEYGDFEMLVDWKITKEGDSGIYLRGTPQVQIWDTSRTEVGAQVGSGGLYNNQVNLSVPLKVADNPVGDWNSFRILMTGEKVSVWLNGELVVDSVTMENYWDRNIPIFPKGPIELQAHGTDLAFRDIYVREINEKEYNLTPAEKAEGFVSLFNGRNLDNWVGNKESYVVEDGMIVIKPENGSGGNLYTGEEFADFIFRFEFQLTPGANNGLGIRAPLEGDAAYAGMELQILDDTAPVYATLQPYQYHGSVYGVIPSKRGFLKPVGEWNYEEVYIDGTKIKITLNGTVIVDGDIAEARDKGTMDHNAHPGLKNTTGHIGFLGHGSVVRFKNIRIKEL